MHVFEFQDSITTTIRHICKQLPYWCRQRDNLRMANKHGRMLIVVKVRNENINTAHMETDRDRERERDRE